MGRTRRGKWLAAGICPLGAALGVACLAVLSGAGAAQQDADGAAAYPPRVAVVDMAKVLRSSSQWQDLMDERKQLLENTKRTLNKLGSRVQVLLNDYEGLPPGTEERQRKVADIEQARDELQRVRRDLETRAARQYNEAVRTIFGKLNATVSAYALEHDIDLVLKQQSPRLAGPETLEQSLLITTTEVLYANPALDISGAVVEELNAEYTGPIRVK